MRQLQKVLWTKGVLLTPQHLQLQDRFVEDTLSFQLAALTANPWGFSSLELDREMLDEGLLALSKARGLFPDGLAFDMPGADPLPEPRPLDDGWQPDQEVLHAYLAISEYRPGGRNVSVEENSRDTRFSAEVSFGGTRTPVSPRSPFRWPGRTCGSSLKGVPGGSSVLPLGRIFRTGSGGYDLDPGFVPPVVDIEASRRS
jgi:type VI secretion system protein ImpJ